MDDGPADLRLFRPGDLDDLYRICLLTAGGGGDGTHLFREPRLPGDLYAAPYALLEPSLALVAEDAAGVGGYVVSALDSADFERRLERDWLPGLRARYPEPPPEVAAGLSEPEQFALRYIHHPFGTDARLARAYPSHLHIDLLPRLQGRGMGRHMMTAFVGLLAEQGSPGVHLHVGRSNQRAPGFYRRLGFTELPSARGHTFALALAGGPPFAAISGNSSPVSPAPGRG